MNSGQARTQRAGDNSNTGGKRLHRRDNCDFLLHSLRAQGQHGAARSLCLNAVLGAS